MAVPQFLMMIFVVPGAVWLIMRCILKRISELTFLQSYFFHMPWGNFWKIIKLLWTFKGRHGYDHLSYNKGSIFIYWTQIIGIENFGTDPIQHIIFQYSYIVAITVCFFQRHIYKIKRYFNKNKKSVNIQEINEYFEEIEIKKYDKQKRIQEYTGTISIVDDDGNIHTGKLSMEE